MDQPVTSDNVERGRAPLGIAHDVLPRTGMRCAPF
jgi:hypothetical protein